MRVLTYAAEKDRDPKRTLDELTILSEWFDRVYGEGNVELALQFVEKFWQVDFLSGSRLDEIAAQCPHGFGEFQRSAMQVFRNAIDSDDKVFIR